MLDKLYWNRIYSHEFRIQLFNTWLVLYLLQNIEGFPVENWRKARFMKQGLREIDICHLQLIQIFFHEGSYDTNESWRKNFCPIHSFENNFLNIYSHIASILFSAVTFMNLLTTQNFP